jgi:hypothetical protein
MSKDTQSQADATVLMLTHPVGEYNAEMEIKAVEDGLMIDEYNVIPWDWILAARQKVHPAPEKSISQCRK